MVRRKKSARSKIYFTILLVILLFGCATPEKYDQKLAGLIGTSEASLLASWGKPSAKKILSNGAEVITYTKADSVYVPSEFYLYNPYSPQGNVSIYAPFDGDYSFTPYGENLGYNPEYTCQTSFLIQDKVVVGWKWVGNDCVAR